MAIYLAGTGPHILDYPLQASVSINGSSGVVDSTYVVNSIAVANTSNRAVLTPFSQKITEGWIHMESRFLSPNSTGRYWMLGYDDNGNHRMSVRSLVAATMSFEFWNGSSWTNFGQWTNGGTSGRFQLDVYFRFEVDGRFEVYQDKELVGSYSGDLSHLNAGGLRHLQLGNPRSFGSDVAYHSQILVCDFATLFAKVRQTLFNSDGSVSGWTGGVASINEQVPDAGGTAITTEAANTISTFKAAARSLGTDEVKGIVAQFSGQRAGSLSPNAVRPIVRIAGVNYNGPDFALGYGNRTFNHIIETDPSTGLPWTPAGAGSADLELGLESRSI